MLSTPIGERIAGHLRALVRDDKGHRKEELISASCSTCCGRSRVARRISDDLKIEATKARLTLEVVIHPSRGSDCRCARRAQGSPEYDGLQSFLRAIDRETVDLHSLRQRCSKSAEQVA